MIPIFISRLRYPPPGFHSDGPAPKSTINAANDVVINTPHTCLPLCVYIQTHTDTDILLYLSYEGNV